MRVLFWEFRKVWTIRAAKLLTKDEARRIAVKLREVARATKGATALALTAHEKIGPPFSGPKLLEVVNEHRLPRRCSESKALNRRANCDERHSIPKSMSI
jgi:hypothetical protein